jgi:hypothetical protein
MSENAVDYVKFAAALIFVCESEFRALLDSGSPTAAEAVSGRLDLLHAELRDAAARFCPGDGPDAWTRYSDGRAVVTALAAGNGCYAYTFHPDRAHPANIPGERGVITTPNGARKRVYLSAPGVWMRSRPPRPPDPATGNRPWHKRSSRDTSRHGSASARAICPSKPSVLAIAR